MRWITKPRIKNAEQFFVGQPLPAGVQVAYDCDENISCYYVTTIHKQVALVVDGDFIVQEPDGVHYYPCKPDIWLYGHNPIADGLTDAEREVMNSIPADAVEHWIKGEIWDGKRWRLPE